MAAEILLGILHLLLIYEAHVAEAAVGEFVHDGAAEPARKAVVDQCAEVGADGGKHDDEENIEAVVGHGFPRGGRHYHLRGKGNKRAFDGHEQGDHPIVEVFKHPTKQFCCIHIIILYLSTYRAFQRNAQQLLRFNGKLHRKFVDDFLCIAAHNQSHGIFGADAALVAVE